MKCGMVHWAKWLDYKEHELRTPFGQELQSDSTWTGPVGESSSGHGDNQHSL